MLAVLFDLSLAAQFGLALAFLLAVFKLYLMATLGVCTSKNRLDGKTVVVTGANTGIGKETALDLATRGARVILACRDLKKATAARDDIVERSRNRNVVVRHLDLASLRSVRKFADELVKSEKRLDVLVNNAGCAGMGEKKLTEDGLELQMATNYFGHFLLTNLLLGLLVKTEGSRIVNVSSEAHRFCRRLDVTDLSFDRTRTEKQIFGIYGVTKLCNLLFTRELAAKLAASFGFLKRSPSARIVNVSSVAHYFTADLNLDNLNSELFYDPGKVYYCSKLSQIIAARYLAAKIENTGKRVTVNALHPGVVQTDFLRFDRFLNKAAQFTSFLFMKTSKEGAQTSIHLAVADEVKGVNGEYFSDCKVAGTSKLAKDAGLAKKLWEVSEALVKLQPHERHF